MGLVRHRPGCIVQGLLSINIAVIPVSYSRTDGYLAARVLFIFTTTTTTTNYTAEKISFVWCWSTHIADDQQCTQQRTLAASYHNAVQVSAM